MCFSGIINEAAIIMEGTFPHLRKLCSMCSDIKTIKLSFSALVENKRPIEDISIRKVNSESIIGKIFAAAALDIVENLSQLEYIHIHGWSRMNVAAFILKRQQKRFWSIVKN